MRTSGVRCSPAPGTLARRRLGEKSRVPLHLGHEVIYNRLDGSASNHFSMSAVRSKPAFALVRPADQDAEKAGLSVTSSTFSFCSFSNRVRKLWTANTHEVRFRRSEAA